LTGLVFGGQVRIIPEYLFLPTSSGGPFLVVHVDAPGDMPLVRVDGVRAKAISDGDTTSALLSEALRPCHSQPWSVPYWIHAMHNWVEEELAERIHTVSQLRVADGGAVLRMDGDRHTHFLKSVPSFLSAEVGLVRVLQEKLPGSVPYVLPKGPDACTHITRAINGTPLSQCVRPNTWVNCVRAVGELQRASTQYLHEIRRVGVFYQPLSDLASNLKNAVMQIVEMQEGLRNQLSAVELREIPCLIDRALRDCDLLMCTRLPDALINTDLNEGGIFVTASGATTFIDWTFSRISHPFLTLQGTLFLSRSPSHRMSSAHEQMRAAYLGVWSEYCDGAVLEAALESASRLQSLTTAIDLVRYMPALKGEQPGHVLSLPEQIRCALATFGCCVRRA
jgi:hypothetical protein